jgi:hypothetical protein
MTMGPAPMIRIDLMSVRLGMGRPYNSRAKGGPRLPRPPSDHLAG